MSYEELSTNGDEENEENHEHGPLCFAHNEHWQDDSVYVDSYGDEEESHEEYPTIKDMIKLLKRMEGDEHVRRFVLVYANGDGVIQCISNPGQSPNTVMNLLANGIRIMAFQEHILEGTATAILAKGALKVRGIPADLADMLGVGYHGKHRKEQETETIKTNDNSAGPYL